MEQNEVQETIKEATRLSKFREKVRDLQKEWKTLTLGRKVHARRVSRKPRTGKVGRDLRTSDDAFRQPILKAPRELREKAPAAGPSGRLLLLFSRGADGWVES